METFFIPRKIKVGYQERSSTYTGKLAYVIYYDQKDVLRKETSWESWRDKKLGDNTFDNEPISGFVLNKHAGGYSSGWNHRQSYCRVYDPRGFEIEITIDNLLWILDWSDCYKGKGLDGKFCYAWNGTDLVLVPECTEDYKKSKEYSESLFATPKTSKKDLIVGSSYKLKGWGDTYFTYIGEFKIQNKLGSRYYSKLLFIKKDNKNILYPVNPDSILVKIADNVISKSEVLDIEYRFSLTAYSLNFWNSKIKFIDSFISNPKKYSKVEYSYGQISWDTFNYKRIIISDDGETVKLFKGLDIIEGRNSSYLYRGDHYYFLYPFIEINKSGEVVTKFFDLGKEIRTWSWSSGCEYPDADKDTIRNLIRDRYIYGKEYVSSGNGLIYKTLDGYYSNSLENLVYDNKLSYLSDIKNIEHFSLPTKNIGDIKK